MTPVKGKNIFIGGTVNNVIRLSKGLTKHGHVVHILTTNITSNFSSNLRMHWGTIHRVRVHGPYASPGYAVEVAIKLLYKTFKIHCREKFDVINIHTGYSMLGILGYLISQLVRIPIVVTLYSAAEGAGSFGKLYKRISGPIERFFLSKIVKIIAISEGVEKAIRHKGLVGENIICIPPAVDLEQFNPYVSKQKAREKLGIDKESSLILYIGSWNPGKGVNTLLEGFKKVSTEFSDVKLVLAWGGVEQDYREKTKIRNMISQLGLESKVIELGAIREVGELMAASDIIVVPYLNTNGIADRPLTIIEAMACGRPVIATNVGGIREIIKNNVNGVLVNPGQPLEIEKALCFLLKDKKKSEMIGINAACNVSQSYSIDRVVTMLEKVYEELL
jgi:glycosyltransferase involved in cell wall biosynthesis